MALYYANGRTVLSSSDWNITTDATGSLTTSTKYFSIQGKSRLGLTTLLISSAIVIPASGKVIITINSSARLSGEDWHYFIIGCSTTNTANTFVQIASIPALDPTDQVTVESFPITVNLEYDSQLTLSTSTSTFPTTNLINGMVRGYIPTNLIYELDLYDTTTADDGLYILVDSGNRWKARGSYSTYISSVNDANGSRQDITTIDTSDAIPVIYDPDNSTSIPINFWLTGDNNIVDTGLRVEHTFYIGSANKSQLLDKKVILTFLGYVNTTSGILRTVKTDLSPFETLGLNYVYNANNPALLLEDDLQVDEAYLFSVSLKFTAVEWSGLLPEGSQIRILAEFSQVAGVYNSLGSVIGDCIFAEGDLRRVVPNTGLSVTALTGSGIVSSYTFPLVNNEVVAGLAINTENQKIAINGNGSCFLSPNTLPSSSALRAIVSTVSGISNPSVNTSYQTVVVNSSLTVTVNYPTTIITDYPDVIAGYTATLNAPKVVIYVQRQSDLVIKKFAGFVVDNSGTSQVFTITNWSTGTTISSIPVNSDLYFSLFKPTTLSYTSAGIGTFTADNYRISYAFEYDGNQVSKITHNTLDGCILELSDTLANLFDAIKYWGKALTIEQMRGLTLTNVIHGQERKLVKSDNTTADFKWNAYNTNADDGLTTVRLTANPYPALGAFELKGVNFTLSDVIPLIIALGGNSNNTKITTVQTIIPESVQTIDWNNGEYVILDLTTVVSDITLILENPAPGTYMMEIKQGSTAMNITFPTNTIQAGELGNVVIGESNKVKIAAIAYNGSEYLISVGSTSYA